MSTHQKLLEILSTRPPVYSSTGIPFWDDDHISQGMLKAHLDPHTDAASRKPQTIDKSVEWLASLTKGRAVLDLGSGPGLYAKRLADIGFTVTGIDISRRSIAYAQNHFSSGKTHFINQNYLSIDYEDAFDLVILIYCDFGVLAPQDREDLLRRIYRSLKQGGVFVVDGHSLAKYADFEEQLDIAYAETGFWHPEPHLVITRNLAYPERNYLDQYVVVSEEEMATYNIWNHAFTATELNQELQDAGFSSTQIYGDVTSAELTSESTTVCVVGRK